MCVCRSLLQDNQKSQRLGYCENWGMVDLRIAGWWDIVIFDLKIEDLREGGVK